MKKSLILLFIYIFGIEACYFLISLAGAYNNIPYYFLSLFLLLTFHRIWVYIKQILKDARDTAALAELKQQKRIADEQEQTIADRRRETLLFQKATLDNMRMLKKDLDEGNYDKVRQYLPEMTEDFQKERFHPVCSDSLINAILAAKRGAAMQKGIRVTYGILLPEHSSIEAPELSSVFFNLMDNGIEGCLRSGSAAPEIHLSTELRAGFLAIHMTNSKNPSEAFNHKSSKTDPLAHGLGLSIIEDICRKYDGSCEWRDNGDTFDSIVLLRLRSVFGTFTR